MGTRLGLKHNMLYNYMDHGRFGMSSRKKQVLFYLLSLP